jgi:protein-disulfide isomerase
MNKKIVNTLSLVLALLGMQIPLASAQTTDPQLERQVLEILRKNPQVLVDILRKYTEEQTRIAQEAERQQIFTNRRNTKALIGTSPVRGDRNAKVVILEFCDFQDPNCAKTQANLRQVLTKYGNTVAIAYKFFPLAAVNPTANPEGVPAIRAAYAAQQQGKFWEYHDALYQNRDRLGEALYLEIALQLRLDMNKFRADRPQADRAIVADVTTARQVAINGLPAFVVNGEYLTGDISVAQWDEAIRKASLASPSPTPSTTPSPRPSASGR